VGGGKRDRSRQQEVPWGHVLGGARLLVGDPRQKQKRKGNSWLLLVEKESEKKEIVKGVRPPFVVQRGRAPSFTTMGETAVSLYEKETRGPSSGLEEEEGFKIKLGQRKENKDHLL